MAALCTAEYLLYANFAALSDDCAHQANVWAWTAFAVPTLVLGPFLLWSFKLTFCKVAPRALKPSPASRTLAVFKKQP